MRYETQAIHAGYKIKSEVKGVNVPIELSTTFVQAGIDDYQDFVYARGNNPTRYYTETLVAQLDGAKYGLGLASGMAATSLVFGLFKKGDKVLFNSNVYGGTYRYFSNIFENHGLEYGIVKDFNHLTKEDLNGVSAVFIETPSNPLLEIYDIQKIAQLTKEAGTLLIVDNTFMTSYYQKPLSLGADIVVYSATKYYSGHSDTIAGFVLTNDDQLYEQLKFLQNTFGSILSPFDSYLIQRGIKTLPVRLDRHQENSLEIAEFLDHHQAVSKVYYPGLKTHLNHDIQNQQATGYGAVLSIVLKDEYDIKTFVSSLKIFDLAVSLGGVESLICHPSTMTHESYSKELQEEIGIEAGLLRLSIGIENINDLKEDLDQALKKAYIGGKEK